MPNTQYTTLPPSASQNWPKFTKFLQDKGELRDPYQMPQEELVQLYKQFESSEQAGGQDQKVPYWKKLEQSIDPSVLEGIQNPITSLSKGQSTIPVNTGGDSAGGAVTNGGDLFLDESTTPSLDDELEKSKNLARPTSKMEVNKDLSKVLGAVNNTLGDAFGIQGLGDKANNLIGNFNNKVDLTGVDKEVAKYQAKAADLNEIDISTFSDVEKADHAQELADNNANLESALKKQKANATMNLIGNSVGVAADITDEYIKSQYDYSDEASSVNGQGRQAYNAVANSLMGFSPYGTIAGGAMKFLGAVNDLAGKKTESFTADQETISQIGGSYGGSASTIQDAASKANKKFGLLDGSKVRKINKQIQEARRQQGLMQDLAAEASDQAQSQTLLSQADAISYQYQLDGGYDQRYMRAAKEGTKLQYFTEPFKVTLSDTSEFNVELTDSPSILKQGGTLLDKLASTFKVTLTDVSDELESFKQGGAIKDREIEVIETNTNQKSVIPEGALHKNKHHLNTVGVDDSELTKKGIPVVDNHGEQQAEIELNEIIFTLEVTKELESRYKEFYEEGTSNAKKDELAIEAGKLLWKEILYNTDDRTGLIDTLKKGGNLNKKEPQPTYAEWVKDVNPAFLSDNYDLETAYKYLPFEQLERWKHAVNSPDPDKYMQYRDPKTGEYIYQLSSVAKLPNGDFIFLKKGTEKTNPELHWETDSYWDGTNGLMASFNLIYDPDEERYFYKKRSYLKKHEAGGIIAQADIDKMVKQALINILTQ